ncbi:MAG: hypothetical protein GF383_07035, partial [Candidatus Lokiarchaeota archaeon]|nr:hypothetical protein [Candidatus Lokiarchaeota archaeon]
MSDGTLRKRLTKLVKQGLIKKGKEERSNTYTLSEQYQTKSVNNITKTNHRILSCIEECWDKLGYSDKAFLRCKNRFEGIFNSKLRNNKDFLGFFHVNAAAGSIIHLFIQQGVIKARTITTIAEVFNIEPIFLKFYFHYYFLPHFPEVQIKTVRNQLIKARALSNKFIKVYGDKLNDHSYWEQFKATSLQEYRPELYDRGGDNFNEIATNFNEQFYPGVDIKERTRQCTLQYPFFALRNHLIDRGNLKALSERLIYFLRCQQQGKGEYDYLKRFIRKGRFKYHQLKHFYPALRTDIFGSSQHLSSFEINNMMGQLRNILLSETHGTLEALLASELKRITMNPQFKTKFVQDVLHSIERPHSELLSYYFSLFVRKFKWDTTNYAKSGKYARSLFVRLFVDNWRAKNKNKNKNGTISDFKDYRKRQLTRILPQIPQFELNKNKPALRKLSLSAYQNEVERLALQALEEVLRALRDVTNAPNGSLLRYIFKPAFHANKITSLDYSGYCEYVKTKFKHHIKSLLPRLFSHVDLLESIINSLKTVKTSFTHQITPNKYLTLPSIKSLSLPLLQHETYQADYSNLRFILQLEPHKGEVFRIHDSRNVIQESVSNTFQVLNSGALALNPTITLRGRILMLNQPFRVLKKVSSIRPQHSGAEDNSGEARVLGVDLGLIHWATCSVMDTSERREVENYFLDSRRIYDCQYDPSLRKNVTHRRFYHPADENIRTKDVNLVKHIRLRSQVEIQKLYSELKNINRQLDLDGRTRKAYFLDILAYINDSEVGLEKVKKLYSVFLNAHTEFSNLLEKIVPSRYHRYIVHIFNTIKQHQIEYSPCSGENDSITKIIRDLVNVPLPKAYEPLSRQNPEIFGKLVVGGILSYLSAINFFRRQIQGDNVLLTGSDS